MENAKENMDKQQLLEEAVNETLREFREKKKRMSLDEIESMNLKHIGIYGYSTMYEGPNSYYLFNPVEDGSFVLGYEYAK